MRVVVVPVENILNDISQHYREHATTHPFLLTITMRAQWFLVDTYSNYEWQTWQQVTLSLETCFFDWKTEWQWNCQVVFSHVDTTHERFSPPQDKATIWKDALTPTVEEEKIDGLKLCRVGQNIRKTLHDIVIQDNSHALKFLLLSNSWNNYFLLRMYHKVSK